MGTAGATAEQGGSLLATTFVPFHPSTPTPAHGRPPRREAPA